MASWARTMLLEDEAALEALIPRSAVEPTFALSVLRLVLLAELGDWTGRIVGTLTRQAGRGVIVRSAEHGPHLRNLAGSSSGASCVRLLWRRLAGQPAAVHLLW